MKMAIALAAFALLLAPASAFAQVHVRGYYRSDGTYVQPYTRSSPNHTTSDNYGPSRTTPNTSNSFANLYPSTPPQTRDADRDGVANMYDRDDDNDGVSDDSDRSQYGASSRSRSSSASAWPY